MSLQIPSKSKYDTNSPAARWSFLVAGILYGTARYNRLYKKDQIRLAELERTKEERQAKEKAEREIKVKREMDELMSHLGVKL